MGDPLYVIAAPILPQKNLPETPKTPFVDFQQLCIYVESFSGSKKKSSSPSLSSDSMNTNGREW
jgi:hypothetical protein